MMPIRHLQQAMLWLLASLLFSVQAHANVSDADALRALVEDNANTMVEKLNREKGLFASDPDAFYRSMEEALDGFVDFRRIAGRVMGRYARQSTPAQRDAFVNKFKRSLFETYAQAVVNADEFRIQVKTATIPDNNPNRGMVDMDIVSSSGARYSVTYSMYRRDDGTWLMENIIAEGINLGLAFRDRFEQEMELKRGDLQAVIDGWSDVVEAMGEELDNS